MTVNLLRPWPDVTQPMSLGPFEFPFIHAGHDPHSMRRSGRCDNPRCEICNKPNVINGHLEPRGLITYTGETK